MNNNFEQTNSERQTQVSGEGLEKEFDIMSGREEEFKRLEEILDDPSTKKKIEFFPEIGRRLKGALQVLFLSSVLAGGLTTGAQAAENHEILKKGDHESTLVFAARIHDKIMAIHEEINSSKEAMDDLEKIPGETIFQEKKDAGGYEISGGLNKKDSGLIVSQMTESSLALGDSPRDQEANNYFNTLINIKKTEAAIEAVGEPMEFKSYGNTPDLAIALAIGDAAAFSWGVSVDYYERASKGLIIDRAHKIEGSGVIHSYEVLSQEKEGDPSGDFYSAKVAVRFGKLTE
jgi:hypothetical protein